MAGHLLVLEDAARILALAGRAERAVRQRDAVGGAKAAEAPALHAAGKALALGDALDVDQLAGDIMVGGELGADVEQGVLGDAELGDPRLGLDLGLAEMAALRLGDVLRLGGAGAELDARHSRRGPSPAATTWTFVERQDGDRHVAAVLLEQAGHPHFLRDHAGAHDQTPSTEATAGQHIRRSGLQPIRNRCMPRLGWCSARRETAGTQATEQAPCGITLVPCAPAGSWSPVWVPAFAGMQLA